MPSLFETARGRLERQYLDVQFDPASGLSREELLTELEQHCAAHPDEPRILTRAWLFHLLCCRGRLAVEPDDYFADKLEHHGLLVALREQWRREAEAAEFAGCSPPLAGAWTGQLDTGHTCPDWRDLLKCGFTGLRDRAATRSGDFYRAVEMVYDGALTLLRRLAAALPQGAPARPVLLALAERPPQTLHEALQLAYLQHELLEMENGYSVRSMGRFDQLYNGFLVQDLRGGRLTREEAKELLKYFWVKFFAKTQGRLYGKPFLFGPEANELSYLAFEVYREMQIVDPKFHVRLGADTPRAFFEQVIACIQSGCTGIVLVNDPAQTEMLARNGKAPSDAADYILIGCYEPAVMGQELNCSGACGLNLAKGVEVAVAETDHACFDDLIAAYLAHLDEWFALAADKVRRWERQWPQVSPSPLLSGTMGSCLEQGRDVSAGGARYNTSGCCCTGLANAVDSLAVIRELVYERKYCSLAELRAALVANWEGYEQLRLTARRRVPKWGNNDSRVDALAVTIADFLGHRINREPNARGGVFQAALYGILDAAKSWGAQTGALPDGRCAGEPLTLNTGASVGMDQGGVTSLINSVTRLDLSQFPNGTVLDLMLHPSVAAGPEGVQTLCALIESHFAQGGMAVQFNLFDAEQLRDAQRHPERYANLQVRVCGWNVRFVDLTPEEQALFIAKAEVARWTAS